MGDVDVRIAWPVAMGLLGLGVWYLWGREGGAHSVSAPDLVASAVGYAPYAWWCGHSRGNAYVHHYPDRVGPMVLPMTLQAEDGTLSVAESEVGRG